ncbi:Transmembrane protein [Entamoeba marina]
MGYFSFLTRYNLVALVCALLSVSSICFLIISFFLPWVENKDFMKGDDTYCNSIFPPLQGLSMKKDCQIATSVWDSSPFVIANYLTSCLLFISIFIIFTSIFFSLSQLFHRKCCCITVPLRLKYLSIASSAMVFSAMNLFIFVFFSNKTKLDHVVNGSLIEVSWGFWACFFSMLLLLVSGFLTVSFSSPPRQKKMFL